MKNFCAVLALCAMFFFAACSGGSKETVYDDTDSGSQSGEKNDSDNGDSATDTTQDNGDSQHEDTDSSDSVDDSGDTVPDNSDPSEPTEDADSSDLVSDDDSDSSDTSSPDNDTTPANPCNPNPCSDIANSNGNCTASGNTNYSCGCKTHYTWNSSSKTCVADTQTVNCTGLPTTGATWNTVSSITQTWNGSDWEPSNVATHNNEASTEECRFKCNEHYTWTNSVCKADQQVKNCTEIPANAEWNTVSTITQTWNSSAWAPSTDTTYNETASTSECRFKCAENYTYENSQCVGAKRTKPCDGLPQNAVWNTAESIEQTWNGYDWTPSNIGVYNTTASTEECLFKCNEFCKWEDSKCVSPCDSEPCASVENSTGHCVLTDWEKYSCECEDGYYWWGTGKGCKNKRPTLGNICTGQNKCYNNSEEILCPTLGEDFFGQDFQYAELGTCTPQAFRTETISGDNVVIDLNTGLMWQDTIKSTTTYNPVKTYCSDSTYAGYNDWRVPTAQELLTIIDSSRYNPATNKTYFTKTGGYAWSSTTRNTTTYVVVGFNIGNVRSYDVGGGFVRCVRGNSLPNSSFESTTVNSNVIVTDTETGLTWQKTYSTDKKTWQEALDYCENLNYAGTDWRLPNKNELMSLVNYEKSIASNFPGISNNQFWSSSTNANNIAYAWSVSFSSGYAYSTDKSDTYYVRCIRKTDDDITETEEKKCIGAGGIWNGLQCTRTQNCSSKPINSEWNGDSYYTQEYVNGEWTPSFNTVYSEEAGECHFKCIPNYVLKYSVCRLSSAPDLPECRSSSATPCYDSSTDYIWSSKSSDGMSTLQAENYCRNLYEREVGGWHLPNISELRTLIINCSKTETGGSCGVSTSCRSSSCYDSTCTGCSSFDTHSKLGNKDYQLWSSTQNTNLDNWIVNFQTGEVATLDGAYQKARVRCVKN